METKNKVIEFVKTHKVKLALAAAAVTGTVIWAITRDKPSNYIDISKPTLSTGEWTLLQRGIKGKFTGCVTGCVNAVDVADLGKVGDALATIEGIDGHEPIRVIFGTERSFN
jgi:hypothetical protein